MVRIERMNLGYGAAMWSSNARQYVPKKLRPPRVYYHSANRSRSRRSRKHFNRGKNHKDKYLYRSRDVVLAAAEDHRIIIGIVPAGTHVGLPLQKSKHP